MFYVMVFGGDIYLYRLYSALRHVLLSTVLQVGLVGVCQKLASWLGEGKVALSR